MDKANLMSVNALGTWRPGNISRDSLISVFISD